LGTQTVVLQQNVSYAGNENSRNHSTLTVAMGLPDGSNV
jgi:hypothetical protein